MVSARRSRSFWQRLSTECDRGGAVATVAERHGVKVRTLSWWRWRLKRDGSLVTAPPAFLPVEVVDAPASGTLQISVRDVLIAVPTGADPRYVAALVAALRSQC